MAQQNIPFASLPSLDPPQGLAQYMPVTDEDIAHAQKCSDELMATGVLDFFTCLSCAGTVKGREHIRRCEPENSHLLPETGAQKSFVEINRYADIMCGLLETEKKKGVRPSRSIRIVQAAFSMIYRECQASRTQNTLGIGPLTSAFFKLRNISLFDIPECDILDSESFKVLIIMLWIYKHEKWELRGGDISLPRILLGAFRRRRDVSELGPVAHDLPESAYKGYTTAFAKLQGKIIPLNIVEGSRFYSGDTIQTILRLYSIMGEKPFLQDILEHTELSREEFLELCKMERDTRKPLSQLLVLFSIMKQYQTEIAYLNSLNEKLVDKHNALLLAVEKKEPVDNRISALEARNAQLEAAAIQAGRNASAAISRERGMKAELAAANKQLRDQGKMLQGHENDRKELAELRETLYEICQDIGDEDSPKTNIVFPYTELPDGIVCFGGHDQWRGKMKELLPGVRFIPPDNHFSSDLIRNAHCIWIHTAYISHKTYYRIIGIARTYNKERRYFRSLSALSSARLLIDAYQHDNAR